MDFTKFDYVLLDACIIISLFENNDKLQEVLGRLAIANKLVVNQINLYEARYILKFKNPNIDNKLIDNTIDDFIVKSSCKIYKNSDQDYIIASDIKAQGGLSPYDALMLAQIENNKKRKICLFTLDQEFNKSKFLDKYPIVMYD